MGPINVFVEAIGLLAIAYATFGVVSFLEVKNLNDGALGSQPGDDDAREGPRNVRRPATNSEDDFAEFVQTQKPRKSKKNSKPKPNKRPGRGGPRACMTVVGPRAVCR